MAVKNYSLPMYGWKPRDYQVDFWNYMVNGGTRAVLVWHRRGGKDITAFQFMVTQAVEKPGSYWHIFPTFQQGKKAIWMGVDNDDRRFLDYFPQEMIESKNSTDMTITLTNGSVYQIVGGEDGDKLVGANPRGLILSEYPLMSPAVWEKLSPVLKVNGGWAVFCYTPRGDNHGKKIYDAFKDNPDWFVQKLTVDDTDIITPQMIQEDRDLGVEDWFIEQEYYCSFDAGVEGSYFGSYMKAAEKRGHLVQDLAMEPMQAVYTGWDIGVADNTVIVLAQQVGGFFHIVDVIEDKNKAMTDYINDLNTWAMENGAHYGQHFGPHDLEQREWTSGASRTEKAARSGLRFTVISRKQKADTIDRVRQILPQCKFNMKSPKVERLVAALRQYHREFDDVTGVFKDKPVHDWSSHYVDAFASFAWGTSRLLNTDAWENAEGAKFGATYEDPLHDDAMDF